MDIFGHFGNNFGYLPQIPVIRFAKIATFTKNGKIKNSHACKKEKKTRLFPDAKLASNESSCTGIETDLEPTEDSFLRRSKRLEEQTQSLD